MAVEFDTPFDPEYPLYTRAIAAEVFPEVLTPLAWSLLGECIEDGLRESFCQHLGVLPEPDRPWFTVGRFAGRLHLNLSVARTVAQRLPGTDPAATDRDFFGASEVLGLPAYVPDPEDARWRRRALPTALHATASATRWVRSVAARVRAEVARTDEFLARRPSSAVLVTRLDELTGELYEDLFGVHMTVRTLASAPLTLARQALLRSGMSPAEAMDRIASVPLLEGARPCREMAVIARTVDPRSPLAVELGRGMGWPALRVCPLRGAAALRGRLEDFLTEFGHRGGNELDPTQPAWAQRPDQVLTLLRPMVLTHPDPAPSGRGRGSGLVADTLVRAARNAVRRGEASRDALVLYTHQIRRVIFELAHRWQDRVALEDLRMLTLAELRGVANGARLPVEVVTRRREEVAWARSVQPAPWSHRRLALSPPPAPSGAETVTGVGGAAGVVRGRVRVLTDPYQEVPDGSVLVCRLVDTAWTPLFVTAAALVTDVGGLLGQAAVVARDLGIPAVVDAAVATVELCDGDLVEVDGAAGVVRVLERAASRRPA